MKTIISLYDVASPLSEVYRQAGYRVLRYDIQRGCDVRLLEAPDFSVYGIISHTPCTHFAGSGARWWEGKGEAAILDGLSTVDATCRLVLITKPHFWVIENPVGRLPRWLGRPKLMFQPHEYGGYLDPIGDQYTKKTCMWGDFNVPAKRPVPNILGSIMHLKGSGDPTRSDFPLGFSKAFFEVNQ